MSSKKIAFAATSAFLLAGAASGAQARCFEPLTDAASRVHTDFVDLQQYTPSGAPGVVRLLHLGNGWGRANIDFYYVTFEAPSGVTLEQFFRTIRSSFPNFARGSSGQYAFGPYEASDRPNDPVREANTALWNSDQPLGALMTFNLGSLFASAGTRPGTGVRFYQKAGDVQVVCATATDFVFRTVESNVGGRHPVAGFRGFGLRDDGNGRTWTFYSKAVDRNSGSLYNLPLALPYVEGVFCRGHAFWMGFFSEFRRLLNARGLGVVRWSFSNHGPVPYPFESGQQPATKCDAEDPGPHEH